MARKTKRKHRTKSVSLKRLARRPEAKAKPATTTLPSVATITLPSSSMLPVVDLR